MVIRTYPSGNGNATNTLRRIYIQLRHRAPRLLTISGQNGECIEYSIRVSGAATAICCIWGSGTSAMHTAARCIWLN